MSIVKSACGLKNWALHLLHHGTFQKTEEKNPDCTAERLPYGPVFKPKIKRQPTDRAHNQKLQAVSAEKKQPGNKHFCFSILYRCVCETNSRLTAPFSLSHMFSSCYRYMRSMLSKILLVRCDACKLLFRQFYKAGQQRSPKVTSPEDSVNVKIDSTRWSH